LYSTFTYAIKELFSETSWYSFSKDPIRLAKCVQELALKCRFVVDGDYSFWDATRGAIHLYAWIDLNMRWFAPQYHDKLMSCINAETNQKASTSEGVFYKTGTTTLSGSAATSLQNTHANAFEKFCCYREQGFDHLKAWQSLGLYGGDDSLDRDLLDQATMSKVAQFTGSSITFATRKINSCVPFLGRLFPNPWVYQYSIADVKRQLNKIGMTTAPPDVSDAVAMRRKAISYEVSDRNTPVLSNWAAAVLRTTPEHEFDSAHWDDISYYTSLFPEHSSWPSDTPDRNALLVVTAENLGIPPGEVQLLCDRYDAVKIFEDLNHGVILDYKLEVKNTVEINGQVYYAPKLTTTLLNGAKKVNTATSCPGPQAVNVKQINCDRRKVIPRKLTSVVPRRSVAAVKEAVKRVRFSALKKTDKPVVLKTAAGPKDSGKKGSTGPANK